MKKMNLNFLGLRAKMVLPLFLLIGLFMFSASTINAQYVSTDVAKGLIKSHVDKVPLKNTVMSTVLEKNAQLDMAQAVEHKNRLRVKFGMALIRSLDKNDSDVSKSIESTYNKVVSKIPNEASQAIRDAVKSVKNEYEDLLKS